MSDRIGFIGDIHGEADLLKEILQEVTPIVSQLVFLGDYVNRGRQSRHVIDLLLELKSKPDIDATFLAGNHDLAFLRAVRDARVGPFLRMGGAATIVSYLDEPVTNLRRQLQSRVPAEHVAFLEALEPFSVGSDYLAAHDVNDDGLDSLRTRRYGVYGHVPQASLLPRVGPRDALIDTGCGTLAAGRLTCFLWPSRSWIQVG